MIPNSQAKYYLWHHEASKVNLHSEIDRVQCLIQETHKEKKISSQGVREVHVHKKSTQQTRHYITNITACVQKLNSSFYRASSPKLQPPQKVNNSNKGTNKRNCNSWTCVQPHLLMHHGSFKGLWDVLFLGSITLAGLISDNNPDHKASWVHYTSLWVLLMLNGSTRWISVPALFFPPSLSLSLHVGRNDGGWGVHWWFSGQEIHPFPVNAVSDEK